MILYIVVPCYNEQEVLETTAAKLGEKLSSLIAAGAVSPKSRAVFVDDGSADRTWEIISDLHRKNGIFGGIKLSRNKGHQNALLAGLLTVKDKCDAVISLDADLQDDVDAIDKMVDKYRKDDCDIVYGVRSSRDTDTFFKRHTAQGFYKLLSKMGVEMTYNHADYRLMSRRAIEALSEFREVNLFLRGIVPMIGFRTGIVTYERHERAAGVSKYPLRKMIAFALEGITSFSVKPIRFITFLGISLFTISILMLIYFIIRHFTGGTVPGWTSLAVSLWAIGGLQLLAIGVIGEYIGKIYLETKQRPKYFVEKFLDSDDEDGNE